MLNAFLRTLSRLSVGRKLLLIYLLDLTAVIYVTGILINEKYLAINFAEKERVGVHEIDTVRERVLAPEPPSLGAPDPLQARGEEIEAARAEVTRIGNESNLILDPDLDSYYTMSLVVIRYPALLQVTHELARLARTEGDPQERRTRFLQLVGSLETVHADIAADLRQALEAGDPALSAALVPPQESLRGHLSAFRAAVDALAPGTPEAPSDALRDLRRHAEWIEHLHLAQGELERAIDAAWRISGVELDRLVSARIDGLYRRMWLHLGTALFLLSVILTLVWLVARQIRVPLRQLAGVADQVSRTGDHQLRAHWDSEDEIGRLVRAFNAMLAELDQQREVQKELAASARAADAQRELVESTPIPIVVTAVPGHEVLQANAPGREWLHGATSDPWAAGLSPSVRSRFFQQLADRGQVQEFEVQWRAGGEPIWAVLSARLLSYQGQQAVLTAFTPINHLKLMERRLALWAKVYEASSESIVILDAQQRITSANPAFYRASGLEPSDVVGGSPDLLAADGAPALEPVWQAVALRGGWQGELRLRRRNGQTYPAWLMVNPVREAPGQVSHVILTSIDVSDRHRSEERIRFLAQHDVLTELPNRSLLVERLGQGIARAQRAGHRVALLFIDLDRFKDINDSLGHHIGDGLLRAVARALKASVREADTVSRQGGDEFVIVLDGVKDAAEVADLVVHRLLPGVTAPHQVEGAELHVGCSVGIAMYPDDAADVDTLMRHADLAMYQAKAAGRGTHRFFSGEMTERLQRRQRLEAALRRAIEAQRAVDDGEAPPDLPGAGELRLHYQPRTDAQGRSLMAVEALLRWTHPELGEIAPNVAVALAEETGLIIDLGAWVIGEACRQRAAWRAQGLPDFGISVNVSPLQLRDEGLLPVLRTAMARHGVGPGVLELEITESAFVATAERQVRLLEALRALGVRLAIDDFGTGYSSLSYLKRFPLDALKVDRGFVDDMVEDATDRAIALAVIALGHSLGLRVVAEGVENEDQAALLRAAGCDELQGWHLGRPMAPSALSAWLDALGRPAGEGAGAATPVATMAPC
jgi:diguanylate cyclase (GGDEF)-like protein/PAS domain S-box-containing protein